MGGIKTIFYLCIKRIKRKKNRIKNWKREQKEVEKKKGLYFSFFFLIFSSCSKSVNFSIFKCIKNVLSNKCSNKF